MSFRECITPRRCQWWLMKGCSGGWGFKFAACINRLWRLVGRSTAREHARASSHHRQKPPPCSTAASITNCLRAHLLHPLQSRWSNAAPSGCSCVRAGAEFFWVFGVSVCTQHNGSCSLIYRMEVPAALHHRYTPLPPPRWHWLCSCLRLLQRAAWLIHLIHLFDFIHPSFVVGHTTCRSQAAPVRPILSTEQHASSKWHWHSGRRRRACAFSSKLSPPAAVQAAAARRLVQGCSAAAGGCNAIGCHHQSCCCGSRNFQLSNHAWGQLRGEAA